MRWYIVQVYSGFEKQVEEAINKKIFQEGLENKIQNVLVPTEDVIVIRKGSKSNSKRKFFPGYILIQMEFSEYVWDMIRHIPKVVSFLGSKLHPKPISESEIQRILFQVQEGIDNPKPSILFEIGEQVRVCDGPFTTFNGFIEDIDEEKSRLKVMVSIFGRATPIDLEYSQVEKVT